MFYKFVGGRDEDLLKIFDLMVLEGSLKFSSPYSFNDPFEFKYISQAPTRAEFERWHAKYAPERTSEELENAWSSFSGPAASWNTSMLPRLNLMSGLHVLCLARRFASHLMWAHYASDHRGFSVRYKPELISALQELQEHVADGDVSYRDAVPVLRWFSRPPNEMIAPILSTKSNEWKYEDEYRVILAGDADAPAIFRTIDPLLVSGVILGARAPDSLIKRALDVRSQRSDFSVEQVSSDSESYSMTAFGISDDRRVIGTFL